MTVRGDSLGGGADLRRGNHECVVLNRSSPQQDLPVGPPGHRIESRRYGEHGGAGLNYALEITKIVDALHLEDKLDVDTLGIRFVPTNPVSKSAKISIGRVSIYRQGR